MSKDSSGSFIPKQNPVKRSRKRVSRHVYIFTIVSYVGLFAAVLASIGVFFYSAYNDRLLDTEIEALDNAIANFAESDMQRVLEFENRLQNASRVFNTTASISGLLQALENSIISSVQISTFSLERTDDQQYSVTASMRTDTFNSAIFQREIFQQSEEIAGVEISNVTSQLQSAEQESSVNSATGQANTTDELLVFDSVISFDVSTLPLNNSSTTDATPTQRSVEADPVSEATTTSQANPDVTNSSL